MNKDEKQSPHFASRDEREHQIHENQHPEREQQKAQKLGNKIQAIDEQQKKVFKKHLAMPLNIQSYLQELTYPVTRDEILEYVEETTQPSDEVMTLLTKLKRDRYYNVVEICNELAEIHSAN